MSRRNENRPGYKKTVIGWLPESWAVSVLDDLVYFRSGGTPFKENKSFWGGSIPWISAKDLKQVCICRSEDYITEKGAKNGAKIIPPKTVVMLVRGMMLFNEVPICITNTAVAFNQDIKALEPKREIIPEFLLYSLLGKKGELRQIVDQAGHGTGRLSTEKLKSITIATPIIAEQKKIAEIITTWDNAIGQTRKLIEAKKRRKTALMQQLLSGKRRLTGLNTAWKEYHLGELFKERVEANCDYLPLLAITGNRGVIPASEIERKDSSSEDKSKYKRIVPGDIGYNTMRMWQGVSAVSELEGIVSPAYTICVPMGNVDVRFMGYLFKFSPIVNLFRRYSQGLVNDTLNLKFHHFSQIRVKIPLGNEQERISGVLSNADDEIAILEKQLAALEKQKRGLMQKLLTGEVRVKV